MNYCKDCKHVARLLVSGSLEFAQCRLTKAVGDDPVTGEPLVKMSFCSTQRSDYGECGPEGKFFEPAVMEAA